MPYINVDVDISEFDDDDLIEELESRGYHIEDKYTENEDLSYVQWLISSGRKNEALLQLSRLFPQLKGLV